MGLDAHQLPAESGVMFGELRYARFDALNERVASRGKEIVAEAAALKVPSFFEEMMAMGFSVTVEDDMAAVSKDSLYICDRLIDYQ
jgi:hypothetical protein